MLENSFFRFLFSPFLFFRFIPLFFFFFFLGVGWGQLIQMSDFSSQMVLLSTHDSTISYLIDEMSLHSLTPIPPYGSSLILLSLKVIFFLYRDWIDSLSYEANREDDNAIGDSPLFFSSVWKFSFCFQHSKLNRRALVGYYNGERIDRFIQSEKLRKHFDRVDEINLLELDRAHFKESSVLHPKEAPDPHVNVQLNMFPFDMMRMEAVWRVMSRLVVVAVLYVDSIWQDIVPVELST